jgi:triacylglycerol esterase/lipase EstA (alpha/beta hydrolase family)
MVFSLAFLASNATAFTGCAAIDEDQGVIGDPSDPQTDEALTEVPGLRNTVIIVHGCSPPPGNEQADLALTDELRAYFLAHGYDDSEVIKYVNAGAECDSTLTQADQLAALVLEHSDGQGQKVDLVAHSMGSLTARLVVQRYPTRIDDFISIAGANHGTATAVAGVASQLLYGAPAYQGMKEMFVPYACAGQTVEAADVQLQLNGCLTLLGRSVARDETPGSVDYLTIRNLLDEIIQPVTSTCLNQARQNDCSDQAVNKAVIVPADICPDGTPCPAHLSLLWDPGVMQMVYNFASAAN